MANWYDERDFVKPGSQSRREIKLPRNFKKHAVILRRDAVKGGNPRELVDVNFRHQDPTDSGMTHAEVHYSMNKKARWNLQDKFRKIAQFQDDNICVSASEHGSCSGVAFEVALTNRSGPYTTAYHAFIKNSTNIDDSYEMHRTPAKSFAHLHDLKKPITDVNLRKKGKKKRLQLSRRTSHRTVQVNRDINPVDNDIIVNNEAEVMGRNLEIDYHCITQNKGLSVKYSNSASNLHYKDNCVSRQRTRARMNNIKFNCQDYNDFYADDLYDDYNEEEDVLQERYDNHYQDEDDDEDDESRKRTFPIDDFVVDKNVGKPGGSVGSSYSFGSDSSTSDSMTSWTMVDMDNIEELTSQKSWVRRISQPGPYLPTKFRKHLQRPAAAVVTSAPIPQPKFNMIQTLFKIDNDCLDDEYLKNAYGMLYYEVNCIPRRFCIDISKAVHNVARISHDRQVNNITAILCFQVEMLTLVDMKFMDETQRGDWSNVSVWMNGNFHDGDVLLNVDKCFDFDEVYSLNEIIRMTAMVGSGPLSRFSQLEGSKSFCMSRQVPLLHELQQFLQPESECIDEERATSIALNECGLQPKIQRLQSIIECYPFFVDEPTGECAVCLNKPVSQIGFCLAACQHWFCSECWVQYSLHELHNGRVPINCPEVGCDEKVDYDLLTTYLPYPQCESYANQLRDKHIVCNRDTWVWCPNHKCSRVILLQDEPLTNVVHCHCGEVWCKECGSKPHWPIKCDQWKKYQERLKSNGDDLEPSIAMNDRVVEVKRCPHCRHPMEKNEGCNHMSCRCGGSFCWSCVSDWTSNSHYNCSLFSKRHTEVLALRDVNKKAECFINQNLYEKAVKHRHAATSDKMKRIVQSLRQILSRNNKMWRLESEVASKFVNCQIASSNDFIKDFVSLLQQGHLLLQFIYVWLSISKNITRAQKRQAYNFAEQTAFCLNYAEKACESKKLDTVELWKNKTKDSLMKMMNMVIYAQR